MGNAAFHSNELYAQLAVSIQPLCVALRDADEKTRANAAGAIGNLIRNGPELSQAMVEHRVVEMLIYILSTDRDPSPQKIALFSLGTMAIYPATRYRTLFMLTSPCSVRLFLTLSCAAAATFCLSFFCKVMCV